VSSLISVLTRVGAEAELELGGVSVVGNPARVKTTPEGGGSMRGATRLEMRRELGAEECRLGIRGRGAVEELREQWMSRGGWHAWVANNLEAIAEKFGHVKWRRFVCI